MRWKGNGRYRWESGREGGKRWERMRKMRRRGREGVKWIVHALHLNEDRQ